MPRCVPSMRDVPRRAVPDHSRLPAASRDRRSCTAERLPLGTVALSLCSRKVLSEVVFRRLTLRKMALRQVVF